MHLMVGFFRKTNLELVLEYPFYNFWKVFEKYVYSRLARLEEFFETFPRKNLIFFPFFWVVLLKRLSTFYISNIWIANKFHNVQNIIFKTCRRLKSFWISWHRDCKTYVYVYVSQDLTFCRRFLEKGCTDFKKMIRLVLILDCHTIG